MAQERVGSTDVDPGRPGRLLASCSAAIALVIDAAYLAIILGQDDNGWPRVIAVATCIAIAGIAAALVAWADIPAHTRLVMVGGAAGAFLSLGVIGLFSIGLPLFVAGILMVIAWVRSARSVPQAVDRGPARPVIALVLGIAAPIAAIALT